ncbi:glomulin isoform X1 [Leptinotarsa decemlineata]|uniref:glomulin isoform X1 n=1 Tax=Leptinotarsa decemlineata TaxID=7539 RepID=UPI003D305AFA
MEENSDGIFVKSVQTLLKDGKTSDVIDLFHNIENSSNVKNSSWDLIPIITEYLTSQCEKDNEKVFICCEQLVDIIADQSNPEEVLLQLIEEIEECTDDIKFMTLLKPLKKVLVRISSRKLISFAWGFNAVQSYLSKCEGPDSRGLVGKEKLCLDCDEKTIRISILCQEVVHFFDNLLETISVVEDVEGRMGVIRKYLIRLLAKPLVFLDTEVFDGIKSRARVLGERIIMKIFQISSDPLSLLNLRLSKENVELLNLNTLGIATLFYLVYTEYILIERVPKVYSSIYFFQSSLHLVSTLLNEEHQILIEKGLKLSVTLLQHVKFSKLSYSLLDCDDHREFCKNLAKIIVFNEHDFLRKSALNTYKMYLFSFEVKGFYLIVYNLISELNHSGLIGYTITQYKNLLSEEFMNNENNFSDFLKGQKLLSILRKFCYLHKKEESDLIELFDQIMASLNLLLYLALRDKHNVTKIWDYFGQLEDIYFRPLRRGIELSRAHYQLKIKEIQEEVTPKMKTSEVSVIVSGQNLLEMTAQEKLNVFKSSLTAFDLIDNLLSRLIECIECKR